MAIQRRARFMRVLALGATLAGGPACLTTQVGQVTTGGGLPSSNGTSSGSGGGSTGGGANAGGGTGGSPTISLSSQSGPSVATATDPNPCEIDLDFGNVLIGQMESATIQVENHGSGPLDLGQVNPMLDPELGLEYGTQQPIQSGASGQFTVTFSPYKVGTVTSTFTIQTNGVNPDCPAPPGDSSDDLLTIVLTATGIELNLLATPNPLDFGNTEVNTTSEANLTLQNTGAATVTGITCTLGGTDANLFQVTDCPSTVAAGAGTTVQLDYSPVALETRSLATLTFSGSGEQTLTVPLFGEPTQ